jgi:hypothetical protein
MMARRWLRRGAYILLGTLLIVLVALVVLLSRVRVELTEHGVHRRLIVPVVGATSVALPIYSGTGDRVAIPGFLDGPVVRRDGAGGWTARWFCIDRAESLTGRGAELRIACGGRTYAFPLDDVAIPNAVAPMPGRVLAISDIEGNARFLEAALRRLGVVDTAGAWALGRGHLVVLGDSVDRGRDVFAVLWRLHGLSAQAATAGGAVHVVLGNHEQYVLRSNISRAHPEHLYALNTMGGYAAAFAEDTVIGGWLRRQPVALKLGDILFVHGGISPEVARSGLGVAGLNAASSDYWAQASGRRTPADATLDAVFGMAGVTQYRGYLMPLEDQYPLATQAQVDAALETYSATTVVVAHTPVPRVTPLFNARVMAINVNDDSARPEVLAFVSGKPEILALGEPRRLGDAGGATLRGFSLLDARDRRLLADMYRHARRLSELPHPY